MLVDFTELRNQVLAGEGAEDLEETPSVIKEETMNNGLTLGSMLLGGAVLGMKLLDRIKYEGKIFKPEDSGTDYGPILGVALGWIPLAFGLGRLSRGVAAQNEIEKYETLVTEAENYVQEVEEIMAEQEEEKKKAESKKAETKENPYQMDLLTEDWKLHKPQSGNIDFGLGIGSTAYGSAFGQQPVFYRRSGKAPGFPF